MPGAPSCRAAGEGVKLSPDAFPRATPAAPPPMSANLESRHFYLTGDVVQRLDGTEGRVLEGMALWAVIRWEDGREEELDQLDPTVWVTERAAG